MVKGKGEMQVPEYIFESSWEVGSKVGGIYTVLSTKARTLQRLYPDHIIFIGPYLQQTGGSPDFIGDETLFAEWRFCARSEGLSVQIGRWNVPGKPLVILVDFMPLLSERDGLFYRMWERFGVDSLQGGSDYAEACIFAYASGRVVESFCRFYDLNSRGVVVAFNEWMLGMGALYIKDRLPDIAVLFTTHATVVGRAIATSGKPLYAQWKAYDGDQMARELGVVTKHSLEKQTARWVDAFTTVSEQTACECAQLLGKAPDVVTPNGFEPGFVPKGNTYKHKCAVARRTLCNVAEKLLGRPVASNAFLIVTAGRYEYRNKGLDLFIDALGRLHTGGGIDRQIIAFLMVPAGNPAPRADLRTALDYDLPTEKPLQEPFITHWLDNMDNDHVIRYIRQKGFAAAEQQPNLIFAPCYLDGADGIFNLSYYDLLVGMDVAVFPSYYEPWGYTPLESLAFGIPTIASSLAGFAQWAMKETDGDPLAQGLCVVTRTDDNYLEAAETIAQALRAFSAKSSEEVIHLRHAAQHLADKASWSRLIAHYQQAYAVAQKRVN